MGENEAAKVSDKKGMHRTPVYMNGEREKAKRISDL